MTTDYRFGNKKIQGIIEGLVSNTEFTEFGDLREYPPVVRVGTVFYTTKEAFADAVKKKLGGCPVDIKKAPDWARCITGGEDNPGVEFVILVDEAILAGYSDEAQQGQFHRVLSYLKLQGKVDKDSGEWAPTTENGRPIFKIEKPDPMAAATIRRFGAFDPASAELASAVSEAARGQKMIDWEPKIREE